MDVAPASLHARGCQSPPRSLDGLIEPVETQPLLGGVVYTGSQEPNPLSEPVARRNDAIGLEHPGHGPVRDTCSDEDEIGKSVRLHRVILDPASPRVEARVPPLLQTGTRETDHIEINSI